MSFFGVAPLIIMNTFKKLHHLFVNLTVIWRNNVSRCVKILSMGWEHRRRMETEAKANVVAPVWGAKLVQFLAALYTYFYSVESKEMVEFNRFCQIDRCKIASAARK